MTLNNKNSKNRGFTIVELLIVIVIIGILAAITIIAYNGITSRAHASAAKSAAQNVVAKAEAYNAENGAYPATWGALTGASSSTSYALPSTAVTVKTAAFPSTFSGSDNSVTMSTCVNSGSSTIVGEKVSYWDFSAGSAATLTAGDTSGTCTLLTSAA